MCVEKQLIEQHLTALLEKGLYFTVRIIRTIATTFPSILYQ